MRLTFLGAAGMVTGSCCLVEAGGRRILVDCGLFQGQEEELNQKPFPFEPATLDAVILTHAHIDHSGRLPLLYKQGYRGPIYTHEASADLATIMLADCAYIQEMDAERESRRARRAGRPPVEPLYRQEDAKAVARLFQRLDYGREIALSPRLRFRLADAGHILGSAWVTLEETGADGRTTRVVFSGDLGQPGRPILQDPALPVETDYLVLESTYGDRLHKPHTSTQEDLREIIHTTIAKGGKVIIPSFAVGRTQEVLYELNGLVESGRLPRDLKVVVDSPLAIAATEVTAEHEAIWDEAARRLVARGDLPFDFPGLVYTRTGEESKLLNTDPQPMVIIAASGMAEAGRVVHHLKHNLWRHTSTILFVGFQAQGTLGRRLLDGAKRVRVLGEEVAVNARIASLPGLSAHADQQQIMEWVGRLPRPPLQTILVHGEPEARAALARRLTAAGHRVIMPNLGESLRLRPAGSPAGEVACLAESVAAEGAPYAAATPAAPGAPDSRSLAAQRMAQLLREVEAVRKAWYAFGPHLSAGQSEELAARAAEALRDLEELRRMIEANRA